MIPMTDAELEELKAGLEGVTPGPWKARLDACRRCEAEEKAEGDIDEIPIGFHARFGKLADAAHIARCSPDAIRSLLARLEAAEGGWLPIETAPTLERVFVAGWQRPSGTCAGYWWFEEDVTDDKGVPMGKPDARLWRRLPPAPTLPPPPKKA